MTFGISFSCLSIFYSILLTITYFKKERKNNFETKLYGWLIITNLVGLVLAILCYFFVLNMDKYPILNFKFSKCYLIYLTTWIMILTMYVIMISSKQDSKKLWEKLLPNMIIIWVIASIITIILPLDYVNTNGLVYSYGLSANFTYAIGFIFEAISFVFMIKNIKQVKTKKYIPIIAYMIGGTVIVIIQKLNPRLLLMTSTETFITFLMYFTIENPDMQLINQLELAKNKADQANNAKSDFLSSMSHEIRTPLNAIVGLSENMQTETNMNVIHSNAKDVVNASYILLDIVNSILDISKIEAGKMEMVNTNYNLKSEVKKLVKLLETRIGEKDLKLVTNISDEIPNVLYGDVNKVKQIITNLVTNAIKYTDRGEVDFTIDAENKDDKCNLTITVKDTGRGIKEEQLKHLYEKFERLESDKNTTIEGTGLGLAITKQLVGMFKGTITVDSIYGKGSTFKVTLTQDIKEGVILEEHNETEQQKYDNVKVLVVDDSNLNLKVADTILRKYNIETELVTSGQESIEKCKTNKYDIVFMDIMMPSMSGEETLKKLKEIKDFNTPVVALTADAMEGKKEIYLSEGFIDYLSKPIQRPELEEVLGKILSNNISSETRAEETNTNNLSYLEEHGIDTKTPLEMFGSEEMYIDSIKTFIEETPESYTSLMRYYLDNDLEDYKILVHKLKSESRYIGLNKFSDMCLEHETKAKEGDSQYIISNFSNLIKEYKNAMRILKDFIGTTNK